MDDWSFWSMVFQGVTALAIIMAVWQVTYHARQMHRDLETEYVKQYWDIVKSTSDEWRSGNFLGSPVTPKDTRAIADYLQLCEDEIELRRNARVTDSTWKMWSGAISSMLKIEHFRSALSRTPNDIFRELKAMASDPTPEDFDPLKKGLLWRRFHGL